MKIKFLGAAREVTGSKHLILTGKDKRILLDCGMYQGKGLPTDELNRDLGFNPQQIDHLVLSHAHIDHSGLIPYLYKLGFRGSVICTSATRDLCAIMLADSGHIQEYDTRTFNKKRERQGLPPVDPLYDKADAVACMELFIGVPFDRKFQIDENINIRFTQNGHMLGGGTASIEIREKDRTLRIAYTGDVGRPGNHILAPPAVFPQADILITEATYGDRLHNDSSQSEKELLDILYRTCVEKGGKLIIPSFSVGRTQDIVYTLNNFYNQNRLPKIDVYVDSPMATNATEVFRLHPECFNQGILEVIERDPDPFGFNSLHYVRSHEDSKHLNKLTRPCVIISASGMMEAGRIKHHLANNISDPKNTILAVGYCAPRTLGAKILRGDGEVSIHGKVCQVKAEIKRIDSYSGHGDYREMLDFLECQEKSNLKMSFIVHGDYEAQKTYLKHMEEAGFKNIRIPARGEEFSF
ncbi:MBL fold metallo-hydrolase RNA specificity domain-containing protein [Bacteroidota bacterium]